MTRFSLCDFGHPKAGAVLAHTHSLAEAHEMQKRQKHLGVYTTTLTRVGALRCSHSFPVSLVLHIQLVPGGSSSNTIEVRSRTLRALVSMHIRCGGDRWRFNTVSVSTHLSTSLFLRTRVCILIRKGSIFYFFGSRELMVGKMNGWAGAQIKRKCIAVMSC